MENNNTKVIVSFGALVIKNDTFLAVQEAKKYIKGKWNIPAGKAKSGEDLLSGVIRETKDETNIDIKLKNLLGIYQHISVTGETIITFIFTAIAQSHDIKYPTDEILDSKWMTFKEFNSLPINKIRLKQLRNVLQDYHSQKHSDLNIIKALKN
jgi:ADP-ribose pyrophosphatase YjhB (NUDIX family)